LCQRTMLRCDHRPGDMRFRQGLFAFASLRLCCSSQLPVSGCTAATTLPAPWAVLGARFWASGVLAPPVGPSLPTTFRTIHVNAPLTTTHAGQLGLQARLQRLGVLCLEICRYSHNFLTFEKPGARFPTVVPSPETHRTRAGYTPDTRRIHAVDNFRPPATFGSPFSPHPLYSAPYSI
jgi:hypothetical protein